MRIAALELEECAADEELPSVGGCIQRAQHGPGKEYYVPESTNVGLSGYPKLLRFRDGFEQSRLVGQSRSCDSLWVCDGRARCCG